MNPEEIINELKKLDIRIANAIEKILGKNPNKEKLIEFLASTEFDDMINELGLQKIINKYASGFDTLFSSQMKGFGAVDLTAKQIEIISRNLELIKNSNGRTVLGYAKAHSELLRTKLIASIINGVKANDTIAQLESIPLTTSQLGAVVNTSYADFSRSVTAEVFADKPEQRFEYFGDIIPTSSKQCEWLMTNQNKEGYLGSEIDAGIETPFGIINRLGRIPNINCGHEWLPI